MKRLLTIAAAALLVVQAQAQLIFKSALTTNSQSDALNFLATNLVGNGGGWSNLNAAFLTNHPFALQTSLAGTNSAIMSALAGTNTALLAALAATNTQILANGFVQSNTQPDLAGINVSGAINATGGVVSITNLTLLTRDPSSISGSPATLAFEYDPTPDANLLILRNQGAVAFRLWANQFYLPYEPMIGSSFLGGGSTSIFVHMDNKDQVVSNFARTNLPPLRPAGSIVFHTNAGTITVSNPPAGGGSVTSIDVTNDDGALTFTGGPITTAGTITGKLTDGMTNWLKTALPYQATGGYLQSNTIATLFGLTVTNGDYVQYPGTATADGFRLTGRTGFGLAIPLFQSVANNAITGFDIMPKGTPANYSADLGVAWNDIVGNDVGQTGTDFEALRLSMQKTGQPGTYATVTTAANGTGSVRPMLLQQNGGNLGIGPSFNSGNLPAYTLDVQNSSTYQAHFRGNATGSGGFTDVRFSQADTTAVGDFGVVGTNASVTQLRGGVFFGAEADAPVYILNSNTSITATFRNNGNVGIGTTNATARLTISGTGSISGDLTNTAGVFRGNGSGLTDLNAAFLTNHPFALSSDLASYATVSALTAGTNASNERARLATNGLPSLVWTLGSASSHADTDFATPANLTTTSNDLLHLAITQVGTNNTTLLTGTTGLVINATGGALITGTSTNGIAYVVVGVATNTLADTNVTGSGTNVLAGYVRSYGATSAQTTSNGVLGLTLTSIGTNNVVLLNGATQLVVNASGGSTVTGSVTNGTAYIVVTSPSTNGLATTNYVNTATNNLAGALGSAAYSASTTFMGSAGGGQGTNQTLNGATVAGVTTNNAATFEVYSGATIINTTSLLVNASTDHMLYLTNAGGTGTNMTLLFTNQPAGKIARISLLVFPNGSNINVGVAGGSNIMAAATNTVVCSNLTWFSFALSSSLPQSNLFSFGQR